MYTHKKMKTNTENSKEVLLDILPRLEELEDDDKYLMCGYSILFNQRLNSIRNHICLADTQ